MLVSTISMAQVGIGTTTPDPSAQLEVQSTSKGLLIPRVTSTGNVANPAEGLLVYQTSAPIGIYVYRAGSWGRLTTTADGSGSSSGAIIPYTSGLPVTMRGGTGSSVSLVGFGNSSSNIYVINSTIDLSGGGGSSLNFAFPVSRAGTITSISGFFSNVASVAVTGTVTITAQLYQATSSSNSFTAMSGGSVTLTPSLTGTVAAGTVASAVTSNLSIPVAAGTRLLLVFSISNSSTNTITGYVSGGVTIN